MNKAIRGHEMSDELQSFKASGPLKWFSPVQGYGFVLINGEDALIHKTVLRRVGLDYLPPDTPCEVICVRTKKGLCVTKFVEAPAAPQPDEARDAFTCQAKVRWYNMLRGFGFVIPQGEHEGPDIFIHATVVRDAGLAELAPNQSVEVRVATFNRGQRVSAILSIDNAVPPAYQPPADSPGPVTVNGQAPGPA